MTERIHVSRNVFYVAGFAAVLTFLGLLWLGKTGDRSSVRDRELPSPKERVASAPAITRPAAQATPALLSQVDHWIPPPVEFVKLTADVSVYNARGKVVKQFPVGKRLRVSKRAGDKVTINYLGDDYTIPTASTEPWK